MKKNNIILMTAEVFEELDGDSCGICRNCRAVQSGCEPDARNYKCDSCGKDEVFGAAELLLMCEIDVVDTDAESNLQW